MIRKLVSGRTADLWRALVSAALAAFLAVRHLDGSLGYYINLRFGWLTWVAVGALLMVAVALLVRALRRSRAQEQARMPWLGLALLTVPFLLGLLPPRPLGTDAISSRALNLASVPAAASRTAEQQVDAKEDPNNQKKKKETPAAHDYGSTKTPDDAPVGSLRDKWRI